MNELDKSNNDNLEFELNPKLEKLLSLSNRPLAIIKEMKNLGFDSAKSFSKRIISSILLNLFFLFLSLFLLFKVHVTISKIIFVFLVIFIGLFFIIYTLFKLYGVVRLEFGGYIFNQFLPLIRKISFGIISKSEEKINSTTSIQETQQVFMNYIAKVPALFRKVLLFFFRKVPASSFVMEVYNNKNLTSTEEKSDFLMNKINTFVTTIVEEGKNSKWFSKTIIINVVVQLLLVYLIYR